MEILAGAGRPGWFAELLADVHERVLRSGAAAGATDDAARLTGAPPARSTPSCASTGGVRGPVTRGAQGPTTASPGRSFTQRDPCRSRYHRRGSVSA